MMKRVLFGDEVEIGISEIGDGNMRAFDEENEIDIIKNQAKLGESISLKENQVARIRTVYGERKIFTKYDEITNENLPQYSIKNPEKQIPVSDGLVTKIPEVGILLPLADCLGVVVFDMKQKIIGLLHSGRQNIEQDGPRKFIEYLVKTFGSNPKDLKLYYSPHAVKYQIYKLDNKRLADAATEQFLSVGILPENIENPAIDTVANSNFPSNSHGDTEKRFAVIAKLVKSQLTTIGLDEKSCGCIVINNRKVLLIESKDDNGKSFWSFPKGHQEIGETDIETALRETKEETGLDVSIMDESPIIVKHAIRNNTATKNILLFLSSTIDDVVVLQVEEVDRAKWVPFSEAKHLLFGYYLEAWNQALKRHQELISS